MAASVSSPKVVRIGNAIGVFCSITPSGSYAANGDTLDLSAIAGLGTNAVPDFAEINSEASPQSGYFYGFKAGTTLANGKFTVSQCAGSAAAAGDIGAGAYPAGVTGDTIKAVFWFSNFGN